MNPYHILGVSARATDEEITRAYKSLAKKNHPDLNPGNAAAERRMGDINLAYSQIKAMRQAGTERPEIKPKKKKTPDRGYAQYYKKPKVDYVWVGLGILVMILLVRLILSQLYGTYKSPVYVPETKTEAPVSYYIVP